MKVVHAPTNSTFVLEPSPQLKYHHTSREFGGFKVPPAPQFDPPLMEALSKKVITHPWMGILGFSLSDRGLIHVCVEESDFKVLCMMALEARDLPSNKALLRSFHTCQHRRTSSFFGAAKF
jgi:hypothetical protein